MTDTLSTWVDLYKRAWESNSPDDIRALFTEDAEYRPRPYSPPWRGHDEIVEGWLEARDEPGDAQFDWRPVVSGDDVGVLEGTTVYTKSDGTYSNLWVIRFAPDGRATAFTEWWMEQEEG
jgi:ketosteroid isomerase-like protein